MDRDPCVLCCTFRPFCLQPPLAVPMRSLGFSTSGLPSTAIFQEEQIGTSLGNRSCPCGPSVLGFALQLRARHGNRPNRVCVGRSLGRYCGLDVRFRLLPTPPHGDAVTFSYEEPDIPRRGLSPRQYNTITGAQPSRASGRVGQQSHPAAYAARLAGHKREIIMKRMIISPPQWNTKWRSDLLFTRSPPRYRRCGRV